MWGNVLLNTKIVFSPILIQNTTWRWSLMTVITDSYSSSACFFPMCSRSTLFTLQGCLVKWKFAQRMVPMDYLNLYFLELNNYVKYSPIIVYGWVCIKYEIELNYHRFWSNIKRHFSLMIESALLQWIKVLFFFHWFTPFSLTEKRL